jgi:hypothetical protein
MKLLSNTFRKASKILKIAGSSTKRMRFMLNVDTARIVALEDYHDLKR